MAEFILTFIIFIAIVSVMAVGVMNGRKPISGSCGGLGSMGVGGACEICGGDTSKCEETTNQTAAVSKSQFYKAS